MVFRMWIFYIKYHEPDDIYVTFFGTFLRTKAIKCSSKLASVVGPRDVLMNTYTYAFTLRRP